MAPTQAEPRETHGTLKTFRKTTASVLLVVAAMAIGCAFVLGLSRDRAASGPSAGVESGADEADGDSGAALDLEGRRGRAAGSSSGSTLDADPRGARAPRPPPLLAPTLRNDPAKASSGRAAGSGPVDPARAAAGASAPGAAVAGAVSPPDGSQKPIDVAAFAIAAAVEHDERTGATPTVAPGEPPEVALETYLATGAASVDRVAQVVGARKPTIETGLPVALTGRVVEAEGGAPVARAQVVASSIFYVRGYHYDHHLREVARVETDRDGTYRIERLNADPAHFGAGGRLYVTVTAEGFAPALAIPLATVSAGLTNRLPDVALARGGESLSGRVLDVWEGKPVVGARLYATGAIDPVTYPKDERPALFVGAPTAVTDAEGKFVLSGLGRGVATISAHAGDDCLGSEAVVLPREGEYVLRTKGIGGRIEGTTVNERGEPVALVMVAGGDNFTHSFLDGRFVLENFRGDVVTLSALHADYAPVTVAGVRDGSTGVVIRMEKPRTTVVLEVIDADSSARIAHVTITFAFPPGVTPPPPTSSHYLAADGRYSIRVAGGATSATVGAEGHASADVTLAGRSDGETVLVRLAPMTVVSHGSVDSIK